MPDSQAPLLPLGIIAGTGQLPYELAEQCTAIGRPFCLLAFAGNVDEVALAAYPHRIIRFGQIGAGLDYLRGQEVTELVLAGAMKRPSVMGLKPDDACKRLLKKLGKAVFGGDDALLTALIRFLESEGFKVIGADSLLGGLLAGAGVLSQTQPNAQQQQGIEQGFAVAKQLGALDIGQAVVIENGYVLGVEAAEGTDALIQRCAEHMREPGQAILVKAKKPHQEARADLPTIGPSTIEALAAHGYAGVAVEAGGALLLESEATLSAANSSGLFVVGV